MTHLHVPVGQNSRSRLAIIIIIIIIIIAHLLRLLCPNAIILVKQSLTL